MSWHPEPDAMEVNNFSLTWTNKFLYMFPTFSLVGCVLAKVNRDKTDAVTQALTRPTPIGVRWVFSGLGLPKISRAHKIEK